MTQPFHFRVATERFDDDSLPRTQTQTQWYSLTGLLYSFDPDADADAAAAAYVAFSLAHCLDLEHARCVWHADV